MPTLPWMSPSAPRTRVRLVLTALNLGSRPNISTTRPIWTLSFAKTSLTAQSSGAPTGDLIPTRWPFCAPSANPLRANATSLRPRLSFTGCTPASLLRSGDEQRVRFAPAGQRLLLWWTWIWLPSPCWGSTVAPGSPLLPCSCSVSIGSAVSAPWYLCLRSPACSALLLRLLMEACRSGAPGAESQCLIVCRHCLWLTAHILPFALSGLCFRWSHVPR